MSGQHYRIDQYPVDYTIEEGLYTLQQIQYSQHVDYVTYNEVSYLDVLNADLSVPIYYIVFTAVIFSVLRFFYYNNPFR